MDFVQNCRLRSFSDGLHLDSTWTHGVQVESIWNLWGRVNYTPISIRLSTQAKGFTTDRIWA
jgi:hypothetical protein